MNNSDNKDQLFLFDNLFNLFLETDVEKQDEDLLIKEGIDIEKIVQKNTMLFNQLKTKARAELYKAKHVRVLAFIGKIKAGIESGREEYQKLVEIILAKPKFEELAPMFRNLDKITDKDKESIIEDSKILDLLDEIEEEFNQDEFNDQPDSSGK